MLELFHGPTAAFKDFGARFLAATMQRLRAGASAAAEHPRRHLGRHGRRRGRGVPPPSRASWSRCCFPKGLVSPTQERQLTCWGDNVHSFRVSGTFDDCQRLVKEAFVDPASRPRFELSSREQHQSRAAAAAGGVLRRHQPRGVSHSTAWRPTSSFPSGNLGNSVACVWARKLGLPIGRIVLAHNANRTVPDFLKTGDWKPRASVPTLASAMDVGTPSNMERLRALFPDIDAVRGAVRAESVSDAEIQARIKSDFDKYGKVWCPHTATAAEVYARMSPVERADARWILVSTAHPAKFREIVEPLIGQRIEMPESLAKLFSRPVSCDRASARSRRADRGAEIQQ